MLCKEKDEESRIKVATTTNLRKHGRVQSPEALKCDTVKRFKTEFYSSKIKDCGNGQRRLQMQRKKLLGKINNIEDLPCKNNDKVFADQVKDFFIQKIQIIDGTITATDQSRQMPLPVFPLREFNCF